MITRITTLGCMALTSSTLLSACMSDEDVQGSGVGINQTTQSLSAGQLESANGTYDGCRNRTGAWSVDIAGGSTLDADPLSVILNDTSCVLTLTSLRLTAGTLVGTPAIELTTSYQASPSVFGSPIEFYANARLSSVTFADDFVLNVLYSDDPSRATNDNTANFDVVTASATASSVPAPDYALAVGGLTVQTDVNNVVQSASGSASLTAGSVTGQTYVVANAAGLTTYAQLNTAYLAGDIAALTATIPASDFALVGTNLTANQVRTLIIANTSNGVRSYRAFQITFRPAI